MWCCGWFNTWSKAYVDNTTACSNFIIQATFFPACCNNFVLSDPCIDRAAQKMTARIWWHNCKCTQVSKVSIAILTVITLLVPLVTCTIQFNNHHIIVTRYCGSFSVVYQPLVLIAILKYVCWKWVFKDKQLKLATCVYIYLMSEKHMDQLNTNVL